MARQIINKGSSANDGTGDTLRSAAGKINDNFNELYTTLGDSSQVTTKVAFIDSGVQFAGLTYNTVLGWIEGSERVVVSLPDSEGTLASVTATQTLTNKTLTSAVLTAPQINDTSADHKYIVAPSELSADRTITLPLLTGADEFVFKTHSQTLANKTLDSAQMNTPTIIGHILDANQAEIIQITPTASAVNHIKLTNAATSGIPQIAAHSETDTNVGLGLASMGAGLIHFQTGLRYEPAAITADAQAVRLDRAMTTFDAGTAISATLADGLYPGHAIIVINEGAANVTVTPGAFAPATSFTLRQEGITQIIWAGDNWHIMSAKLFDSSDADALIYVTT